MSGHLRQRSTGSWEIRVTLPPAPTGARRVKTETVRGNKRDAQRRLRELLTEVDRGVAADAGRMTTGQWLTQWLAECQHAVSPKTYERYAEIVRLHLVPALGATPLARLALAQVQAYYAEALANGRRDGKGGLSAQTVVHHARVLSRALTRARQLKLITLNPTDDAERPRVERREIKTVGADQAAQLLAAAAATRHHVTILLVLSTGLRRGEVLALRWADIDLAAQTLTVVRSLEQTNAGLRFKTPKSPRSRRTVALSSSIVEALQDHRVRQLEERMQLGLGRSENDLVFTRQDGTPIPPDTFTTLFAKIAQRAGVRISCHGLRHTHVSDLLRAGVHPKVTSERVGHSSVGFTLDRYSHVMPSLQEEAARRMDSALRQISGRPDSNRVATAGSGRQSEQPSD